MDGSASYIDACKNLLEDVSDTGAGSTYVLIGPEGYGKTEAITYLQSELGGKNFRIFRGSSYLKKELSKYHLFNQILNDAFNQFKNRDIEGLMNGFNELLMQNNGGRTVVVADGLESVSDESKDFFLFLSRQTRKYNFKLLGTYTTRFEEKDQYDRRFLQILGAEDRLRVIHLEKMKLDDFRFFLEFNRYNLPDRFVNDLFRLVDGNINMLKYTLKYYKDHGIINDRNEVDDVVYRFFPIPQGLEIHYEKIFSDLTENQVFVAELLALIQEETHYGRISTFAGLSETEMLKILSRLEEEGIVSENNLKYDISNYRIRDLILKRIKNTRRLEIYSKLSQSDLFSELPVQLQMNILLQKGDIDQIGELIFSYGNSIISKFASVNSLLEFLNAFLECASDESAVVSAYQTKCDATALLGEAESAAACYRTLLSEHPDQISAKINLARLTADLGKYSEALEIINSITPDEEVRESDIGQLYLAKGAILTKERRYEEAKDITQRAREILRVTGDREKEAEALNVLGNISLETFRHEEAMRLYEDALAINREMNLLSNAAKNLNNIAIALSYKGEFTDAVNILNELIESSYLTGQLVTRAYATYNLAETYYIIGKIDEVKSYIPSALKLVGLANRKNLEYGFFRFLSILYLNELDVDAALETSRKAMESVDDDKDSQLYKLAYAMTEFYTELVRKEKSDILPSLFLEDFPEDEEFLPIFYSMAAIFFVFRGDYENAVNIADRCVDRATSMGERYGYLMSLAHKAMVLFYMGENKQLEEFLEECPDTNTGSMKYNLLMDVLKLCVRASDLSKEDFLKELEDISAEQRETVDLVRLYKETMVFLAMKRTYGETIDMSSILENVPKNFMYAFNVFARSNSIT